MGRRARARRAGLLLVALALVGAGSLLGWYLRGWVPGGGVGKEEVKVSRPVAVESGTVKDGTAPNVLGLGVDEARQALSDSGVEASGITVKQIPFVAAEGSVVEQVPAPAAPLFPATKAELRVAKPATVPDLTGLSADEARQRLAAIGAGITTTVRYESSTKPGTVSRSNPAAGQPATARVSVVVSEAPSSVNVSELDAVTGDCSVEDVTLHGADAPGALVCSAGGAPIKQQYDTNDKVTGFGATLALADGSPAGARGRLIVREGKRVAGTFDTSGPGTKVEVPLKGDGRLTLEVDTGRGSGTVDIVLADARILGPRSGIDELVAKSGSP